MSLLIIPNLRYISGTSITVPAGQTWIVRAIVPSGTAQYTLSCVIDTVSIGLFDNVVHPDTWIQCQNGRFMDKLILKAGDSITCSVTAYVAYWILEQDFLWSGTFTIPVLRPTSGVSITVPAGETWIVKVCSGFAQILTSYTLQTCVFTATINGNAYSNLAVFQGVASTSPGNVSNMRCSLFNTSMILKPGDTLNSSGGNATSISVRYWILEQDF